MRGLDLYPLNLRFLLRKFRHILHKNGLRARVAVRDFRFWNGLDRRSGTADADHMKKPQWKDRPELCANCPKCKELYPLGYNYCPDCGSDLKHPKRAAPGQFQKKP